MTDHAKYTGGLPMLVGCLAVLLLVGGIGLWSLRTEISGAIIANGRIVVENNRQEVQHAEGGIVGRIAVRDGAQVVRNDLLLELDGTLLQSELSLAELQLTELTARRARLEAERDDADTVGFPMRLLANRDPSAQAQIEGQRVLFAARRETFEKELRQNAELILQTRNQIRGQEAQLAAIQLQTGLIHEELGIQTDALERGLTQAGRVLTLRREAAQLAGSIGRLTADIARSKSQIAGLEIERVKLQNERREMAIGELRDIQFRELELTERRLGLLKRIDRLEIRAPVDGVIFGMTVFSENAVVRPAETLLYVVPQDQPLVVSAEVDAVHIDQIYVGQTAFLRFSAFNQRLTPEVEGVVKTVSADVFQDDVSGSAFYRVEVAPLAAETRKLDGQNLVPGMPVEAFLRTENRTPLSYLTKPLTDYFGRAFRES